MDALRSRSLYLEVAGVIVEAVLKTSAIDQQMPDDSVEKGGRVMDQLVAGKRYLQSKESFLDSFIGFFRAESESDGVPF